MAIQPIETRYKGHRFRSRLEARWAVFMDHLDVPWEYEPQGYLVDNQPYLPDFLVHPNTDRAFWLEIKGTFPSQDELDKARGLAAGTGMRAFVYWAKPEVPAPDLSHLTEAQYAGWDQLGYVWTDDYGWREYPNAPAKWQLDLTPTAFLFTPNQKPAQEKSGFWWWTECTLCGHVRLAPSGQEGWCPTLEGLSTEEVDRRVGRLYPRFRHRTPRILAAYTAARSARFEHGESGA